MKILFATDGHGAARLAQRFLAAVADENRTSVVVASVIDTSVGPWRYPTIDERILERVITEATAVVDTSAAELEERRWAGPVEKIVAKGRPADEVVAIAQEVGAELIVVGGGNTSWRMGALLGSVSNRLLTASPIPVLVVREEVTHDPVQVLVATDGSDHARVAAELLSRLVSPDDVHVTVASVVPPPPPGYVPLPDYAVIPRTPSEEEGIKRSYQSHADKAVASTIDLLHAGGIEARGETIVGRPAEQLLTLSERHDLVVVGCHGYGAIRRAFLGSVSLSLARGAPATLVARDGHDVEPTGVKEDDRQEGSSQIEV